MQAISRMDPARLLRTQVGETNEIWARRVVSVGRWMTVLGMIRLVGASANWFETLFGANFSPSQSLTLSTFGQLIAGSPPVVALAMIWPVVLGILVSRTHWPEFLRAASVTFFLLAVSGTIRVASAWLLNSEVPIAMGTFGLSRSDLALSTPNGVGLVLLSLAQLSAELFVAGRSIWLLRQSGAAAESIAVDREDPSEEVNPRTRSILSQGGWLFSLAFLILVVRLPALPKISSLVESSPLLRNLLLMNDRPGSTRRSRPHTPTEQSLAQERELYQLLNLATSAWGEKHYEDASNAYQKAIAIYRSPGMLRDQQSRNTLATHENNLAWLLVTRPDPGPDDPERAVETAQHALSLNPADGTFWNTLGAAQYRAKNWQPAKEALLRSMELRGDGDGYDWILFALVHAQTGRTDRAREWYDKAARWRREFRPWDQELFRFESEAQRLLGLPDPPIPPIPYPYRNHDEFSQMTFKGRGLPVNPHLGEPKKSNRSYRRPYQ